MRAAALAALIAGADAGSSSITVDRGNVRLAGGATFISGHGAPTGMAIRSGSSGASTGASFPSDMVLSPGSTVTAVSLSYRYIVGYEKSPSGTGATLSVLISDLDAATNDGTVVYTSPHLTQYAYSHNESNYSAPVPVHWSGASKVPAASAGGGRRLQMAFHNNDRNLQILVPFEVNITCTGADACLVKANAPKPAPAPPPPAPPTPAPPKSDLPWLNIGPKNIGDSIPGLSGEAGTIAPAVSVVGNPDLIYMGGNNNAAASGVLKSIDYGEHWTKVNVGLFDTRLQGLHIVDDKGDHVLAGTPSGVFETLDGAKTWTHVEATAHWGVCNSFRNGTIGGKPVIFVGANAGLGNVPVVKDGPMINETWSLIHAPPGHSAWRTNLVSLADFDGDGKPLENSIVAACLWVGGHGVVHIATVLNETAANYTVQLDQPCQSIAIDPNNADHLLVNNASNGAHVYESFDGGQTYHSCLDRRGAVMVAVDRRGWFYTGSEAGLFRNMGGCSNGSKWEVLYVNRTARRNGAVRIRSAHDYQRINIDFAGGMAFGSDQGMFIMNGTELQMHSANGDVNNNIIMHPAIAENADTPGETCIVTALWDWSPVASWDSGKHWPSWQTPDDGSGMNYFGEGGGCFGVGKSPNVLCMHHHNVAYSSRCGKNMSRLVIPNGASVTPPVFTRKAGSRSEPSGAVYAMMTMGQPPWTEMANKSLTCPKNETAIDLGVHQKAYECQSHADLGSTNGRNVYGGANVALWRGDTDKHCVLCKLSGPQSGWGIKDQPGSVIYALQGAQLPAPQDKPKEDGDGEYAKGEAAAERRSKLKFESHVRKTRQLELEQPGELTPAPASTKGFSWASGSGGSRAELEGGNPQWILKSNSFGGPVPGMDIGSSWTWLPVPEFLQGFGSLAVDPTNSSTLYAIKGSCIARSYDGAETWEPCWQAPGLEGNIADLVIKDSLTMLAMRSNAVPLRTQDGGASWKPLNSMGGNHLGFGGGKYSWSGKTLAISKNPSIFWVSQDDGDTWLDVSSDYTALQGGLAQWYENTLYVCSLGQGISAKVFNETER